MKITQQIRIAAGALGAIGILVAGYELLTVNGPSINARALNQTGLVRGGTQRLIKQEIAGQPNVDLLNTLDGKVNALLDGGEVALPGGEKVSIKPASGEFREKMSTVKNKWTQLKATVEQYRANPNLEPQLYKASEDYFGATNEAAFAAENIFNANIANKQRVLIAALLFEIALAAIVLFTLQRVTKTLQNAVDNVSGRSTKIAASVDEQGRIISDQSASVTETTSTIEGLGLSTLKTAQQADASASTAKEALDLSENGLRAAEETLEGISELRGKVSSIADNIMQLSEQTDQITSVSKLVADLADQTNMLALNAAVEAARAGEQGKGFAVVAGEIRKLADQSRSSADKINTLVGTIQSSINSTVMVTDEGNKTADVGIRLTESTMAAFQQIEQAIKEVSEASQNIALSSKQQAVGVQQAVSSMNAINLGAQESSTFAEQVKTTSDELANVAENLQVTV